MATGWANEGAVQEQVDASIKDAIDRARRRLPSGLSLSHCQECGCEIPIGRQQAIPGVHFCVACQEMQDSQSEAASQHNRRGSKDSQLR
ncbi:MAG: DksA/TraR family C4-type zinc finger protein [Proteobacteria bacterium]|nr:DksA/TraR family C4-type zinc finger protein [Pseudomonadota bacterium]